MSSAAQAFILFVYIWNINNPASPKTLTTAEFLSKVTCENAGEKATTVFETSISRVVYFCVPK